MQGLLDILSRLFTPVDRWIWRYSIGVSDRYYRDRSNVATIKRLGTLMRIITRRKSMSNMQMVLGEETRNEAGWKQLWDAYAYEVARGLMEMVMLSKLPNARLFGIVELKGEHHLREALEQKRGAMLFLSHLGAMATVAAAIGPRGYDATLAGNVMPRPYFEERLREVFLERGVKRLLLGDNLPFRAAEIFRRNGIFATFFDHAIGPKHNVWVPFGRAETSISLGPAIIALRCQTPILPVSHRRIDEYRYEIEIGAPIAVSGESLHDKARVVMQHAMAWLADDLVGRPEQWWPWDFAVIRPVATPQKET